MPRGPSGDLAGGKSRFSKRANLSDLTPRLLTLHQTVVRVLSGCSVLTQAESRVALALMCD